MTTYEELVIGTSACAMAISLLFLFLVLRRYLSEKNKARRDDRDTAITRSYLQRVAGQKVDLSAQWSKKAKLIAIGRILPLLRGQERIRLLQIAELDGVLAETLRTSHSLGRSARINAIQLLQRFGSEVCIARLRELMARDQDSTVQLEAAFALASNSALPPPRETLRLLKAMRRRPTRLDSALLRSTARLYPAQTLRLLEDELAVEWRAEILDALGWSEDLSVIDVLRRSADDPTPDIRAAVMRASAKLGHPAAGRWILAALSDPVTSVRLQAISASLQLGLKDAVPQLLQLRNDQELWVRLRAEQALERLAPDKMAPPALVANE